ncbi:MAG: amidohydrolase [Chloroflexi bacterium]|nr:amidohydrolase [Chloroflexota bacterium]
MSGNSGGPIIDSHTHILPDSFRRDRDTYARRDRTFSKLFASPKAKIATGDELIESMDGAGVDRCVTLGYGWTDLSVAGESNDYLLEQAEEHPNRFIPFCSVNPTWGDDALNEIRRCAGRGARGVGELHPDSQGYQLSNAELLAPMMALARELDLVVLTHSSEPVGHQYPGKGSATPSELEAFLVAFPENKIVFAHFGGGLPFYALMPEVKDALKNCYFDTAAAPYLYDPEIYTKLIDLIGPRLIFGSDFPLIAQKRALEHLRAEAGTGIEMAASMSRGATQLFT